MEDAERDEVSGLWERHLGREFPADFRGEEVDGVDLVMLDADAAGCIETWLGSSSNLDAAGIQMLPVLGSELDRALPALRDTAGRDYFASLRGVVVQMLAAQRGWA
jgi:hypothetical protein